MNFILLFLVSLLAADFEVGNLYDYTFESSSTMNFYNGGVAHEGQVTYTSALVSLYVRSITEIGQTFDAIFNNVRIIQKDYNGVVVDDDSSELLQGNFSKYFRFSLDNEGGIFDAYVQADEDENVLAIKSGIIGQFNLKDETSDNQGMYTAVFSKTRKENTLTYSRSYTEKDFSAFHHKKVSSARIAVASSESKVVTDNVPQSINATSEVFFSGEKVDPTYNGSAVTSKSVISLVLSNFGKGTSHYFNGKLVPVAVFDRSFYLNRLIEVDPLPLKKNRVQDTNCPNSSLDLCYQYENGVSFGNSNFGGSASVNALAGINNQCPAPTRNFVAKASAEVDFTLLGVPITVGNASLGYGWVDGVDQRNGAALNIFNKTVWEYDIPNVLCQQFVYDTPTYTLLSPSYSYTYYVLGIVPVTFEVGLTVTADVELSVGFCDRNTSASASVVPELKLEAYASVASDIVIAKGGIKLSVTGAESLNPTISIDGAKCALDLTAYLSSDYKAAFTAWYQYYKLFKWSDVKSIDIFDFTIYESNIEILNYEWTLPVNAK